MQYSDEQLNKVYEKLPQELQDAIFSGETAETIGNTCEQYGIADERVSKIARYVGDVLIGLILPSEFEDTIRKNVELPEVLVKAISSEISRFIFYPVKASLEQIHKQVGAKEADEGKIGIVTPRHSDRDNYVVEEPSSASSSTEELTAGEEEKPVFSEDQGGEDPYREKAE